MSYETRLGMAGALLAVAATGCSPTETAPLPLQVPRTIEDAAYIYGVETDRSGDCYIDLAYKVDARGTITDVPGRPHYRKDVTPCAIGDTVMSAGDPSYTRSSLEGLRASWDPFLANASKLTRHQLEASDIPSLPAHGYGEPRTVSIGKVVLGRGGLPIITMNNTLEGGQPSFCDLDNGIGKDRRSLGSLGGVSFKQADGPTTYVISVVRDKGEFDTCEQGSIVATKAPLDMKI